MSPDPAAARGTSLPARSPTGRAPEPAGSRPLRGADVAGGAPVPGINGNLPAVPRSATGDRWPWPFSPSTLFGLPDRPRPLRVLSAGNLRRWVASSEPPWPLCACEVDPKVVRACSARIRGSGCRWSRCRRGCSGLIHGTPFTASGPRLQRDLDPVPAVQDRRNPRRRPGTDGQALCGTDRAQSRCRTVHEGHAIVLSSPSGQPPGSRFIRADRGIPGVADQHGLAQHQTSPPSGPGVATSAGEPGAC